MIVRELITKLGFKVDDSGAKSYKKAIDGLKSGLGSLVKIGTAAAAALAAVGVAASFKIIETAAEYQSLRKSLESLTGSASGAEIAFGFIKRVAKTLPVSVQEVTRSFISLKGAGLDTSKEVLTAFANIAASRPGKSLQQVTEAVLDAVVGENERLKEFGIKAADAGDEVDLTFRGVTTRVKKNAADINAHLVSIGNVQLAGTATKQMDTFNGALSNAKDSLSNFFDAIGRAGILDVMTGALKNVTVGSQDLAQLISDTMVEAFNEFLKVIKKIKVEDVEKAFKKIVTALKALVAVVRVFIDLGLGLAKAFNFIVEKAGSVERALGIIAFAVAGLTAVVVTLGAALGVATGGLSIVMGAAATGLAAGAVAVAASGGEDQDPAEAIKKKNREVHVQLRSEFALQENISKAEIADEERRLGARAKGLKNVANRERQAKMDARKERLKEEKARKRAAKKALADRKKDNEEMAQSLKSQARFLAEDSVSAFFQDLLNEGVGAQEASFRAAQFRRDTEAQILQDPQSIARRVASKKEADKRAKKGSNLLGTLTGGRLTSKRLGSADKPGFGAQVLRINVNYHPRFDTVVNLKGTTQSISANELSSMMKTQFADVIDKRNAEAFRQIIDASSET